MAQLLIRNLSPETVDELKQLARQHRRSLEAEARSILEDSADYAKRIEQFRAWSELQLKALVGRPTSDSVELLREDRAR